MVLDPAAVSLGFWSWSEPGMYYGVPLVNFVGWVLSGGIAIGVLEIVRRKKRWPKLPALLIYNVAAIIFFWSAVNAFYGQWIPVFIGGVLLVLIRRHVPDRKVID